MPQMINHRCFLRFFFFNDTATTEIYTLSLHDALPIYRGAEQVVEHGDERPAGRGRVELQPVKQQRFQGRSEEHTSELQSHHDLVCRLLLEKKKIYHRHQFMCHLRRKAKPTIAADKTSP